MFKLSTKLSQHHRHILRRTAPRAARISSTTHAAAQKKTPKSMSETKSDRKIPNKDDVSPTPKESTLSGTHDEIAHTSEAAYGPSSTNPVEEKEITSTEKKKEPGNPLEFSPATPGVSHQPEDKRPEATQRNRSKTSGGSESAWSVNNGVSRTVAAD